MALENGQGRGYSLTFRRLRLGLIAVDSRDPRLVDADNPVRQRFPPSEAAEIHFTSAAGQYDRRANDAKQA